MAIYWKIAKEYLVEQQAEQNQSNSPLKIRNPRNPVCEFNVVPESG